MRNFLCMGMSSGPFESFVHEVYKTFQFSILANLRGRLAVDVRVTASVLVFGTIYIYIYIYRLL